MTPEIVDGLVIGFAVALPFGPVSLICVQRALGQGMGFAIANRLGAVTAHGVFSILARAWSNAIGALLGEFQTPIHLLGAAVMVWFGLIVIAKRSSAEPTANRLDLLAAYGSTLLLALCNPMTILPYLAAASGFVVRVPFYSRGAILTPLGVVLGATSWYVVLSGVALLFRRKVSGI